jgi:hypothetical protein
MIGHSDQGFLSILMVSVGTVTLNRTQLLSSQMYAGSAHNYTLHMI